MAQAKTRAGKKATKKVSKKTPKRTAKREITKAEEAKWIKEAEWRVEMMTKEEPLNPKLKRFLEHGGPFGLVLKHPLLVTDVDPNHAAWVNWCVDYKETRMAELRVEGDWKGVMGGYAGPFLVHGFCKELANFDDATYWELLAYIWTEQEQLWPNRALLLKLFKSPRSERDKLMTKAEHRALAKLPDSFPLYRGFIGRRGDGLSWTTSKKKAIWFAKRFAVLTHLGQPKLFSGEASKSDVLAYFSGRGESEVVIDPAKVKGKKTVEI
jgi:hypothetical protein